MDEVAYTPALSEELAYAPAHELAARIRGGSLAGRGCRRVIAGIETQNPSLNALVYLGFDDARKWFHTSLQQEAHK